ncbi:hypothetical protein LSAT2_026996 [Lamellibrachia satsuma]|nr:hypothetical protein LSAT2_026996 [Lamellibrachia satsuma]
MPNLLARASFTVDHSLLWPASSIECLDLQLRCHRVSQPFAIFLTEFRDPVERVGTKCGIINVPYVDISDAHARTLHDILPEANTRQSVTDATHNRGNVFDLGITASSSSSHGICRRSCHRSLCFFVTSPCPPRKKITYCRYAAIDNSNFMKDLCQCDFSSQIQRPSANVDNAELHIAFSPPIAFQPALFQEVTTLLENGKTKSSKIDLSIAILKANTAILAPIFGNVINLSYESSTVPAPLRHAVMTPLLKSSGRPVDDYATYRPISNLPYASKLLERCVSAQLRLHLQHNGIGDLFQSAFRPSHNVETAIVCIQDDTLRSLDARKHVVLVLLDLGAVFDTIDHDLLLAKLDRIGVRGDALC